MDIDYHYENMWAHLGMGYLPADRDMAKHDMSPYINLETVDPLWLSAVGSGIP